MLVVLFDARPAALRDCVGDTLTWKISIREEC